MSKSNVNLDVRGTHMTLADNITGMIDIFPVKAFIYTINFLDGSLCQSTLYGGTTYDEHHTFRSNLMNIPKRDFKLETIDELSW